MIVLCLLSFHAQFKPLTEPLDTKIILKKLKPIQEKSLTVFHLLNCFNLCLCFILNQQMTSALDTKRHSASRSGTSSSKHKHSRHKQDHHSRVVGANQIKTHLLRHAG